MPIATIASDKNAMQQVASAAISELRAFARKYENLQAIPQLAQVFVAINHAIAK
ncbi:MAG: hypothetical protein IAE94_16255 [Chthoniobacterales bacterium]|nr:hypothetical protein [Chthoniobacterales bacterium]